MFTAWGHVRTLSPEDWKGGGGTLPLAALEVTKRRGCSLLPRVPTPRRGAPSLLWNYCWKEEAVSLPCPRAGGGAGAAGRVTLQFGVTLPR